MQSACSFGAKSTSVRVTVLLLDQTLLEPSFSASNCSQARITLKTPLLTSTCSRWTSLPRIPSSTGTRPSSSDILPSSPSSWDPSRPASSPALTSLLLSYNDRGAQAAALLTPPAYILNALRTKHYSVNSFLRANAFFVFLAGPPIGAAVAQLRMRSYTTKEEVKQRVQALAVDVSRLLSS